MSKHGNDYSWSITEPSEVKLFTYTKDNFLILLDSAINAVTKLVVKRDAEILEEQKELGSPENIYQQLYGNILVCHLADKVREDHMRAFRKTIPWWKRPSVVTYYRGEFSHDGTLMALLDHGYTQLNDDEIIVKVIGKSLAAYVADLLVECTKRGIPHHHLTYVIGYRTVMMDTIFNRLGKRRIDNEYNQYHEILEALQKLNKNVVDSPEATVTIDFKTFNEYNSYITKGT